MEPKYYRLKQTILENIKSGRYKKNHCIPSERELINTYHVSRITVRKAIEELEKEGLLNKVHGKGTYVVENRILHDLIKITSYSDDVKYFGLKALRKVISFQILEADIAKSIALGISEGNKIFELERLLFADDEPLSYTITYLPYNRFVGLDNFDYSQESLYKVIENKYKIKITKAKRSISAVLAHSHIATLLNVKVNDPILLFECQTLGWKDNDEFPIEYFYCYYVNSKFKFYINQVR